MLVCGLAAPEPVGADGPTSWTAIQAPGSPGSLSDLTCPDVGSCVAISGLGFESLSSGTWTYEAGSLPSNAGSAPGGGGIISDLESLACTSTSFCVAVGGYSDTAGAIVPLALTLSDGSVTSTELPLPTDAPDDPYLNDSLNAIACTSDGTCVAVGAYDEADGTELPLVETLSDGTWTPSSSLPSDAGDYGELASLQSVSCRPAAPASPSVLRGGGLPGGSDRHAHRRDLDANGGTVAGQRWRTTFRRTFFPPLTVGRDRSALRSASIQIQMATSSRSSKRSQMGRGPQPRHRCPAMRRFPPWKDPRFILSSCSSVTSCVAIGSYKDTQNNNSGNFIEDSLIETLSNGSWSATEAPLPTNATGYSALSSVACPAADACVATGSYVVNNQTGASEGLFESQTGSSWTASEAPLPTGITYGGLGSVSCPLAGSCVAVGGDIIETTVGPPTGCNPPVVTSLSSTTATIGSPFDFTVTTCTTAVPTITASHLPPGLALVNNQDGTATISGTPTGNKSGLLTATITAKVPHETNAVQSLIIAVQSPPMFKTSKKATR